MTAKFEKDTTGDGIVRLHVDEDDENKTNAVRRKSRPISKQYSFLKRPELKLNHSGFQRLLPRSLRFVFADTEVERSYRQFCQNEKNSDLKSMLLIMVVLNTAILVTYTASNPFKVSVHFIILAVLFFCLVMKLIVLWRFGRVPGKLWIVIPPMMWLIQAAHVACEHPVQLVSDALMCLMVYTYAAYVLFPLPLHGGLIYGLLLATFHFVWLHIVPAITENYMYQMLATVLMVLCANILGTISYFINERQQRKIFLETRNSIEAKCVLEEETLKQERLLLSVLPRHVAVEIRKDLGEVVTGQFKKIYMSRHENVSILFADIVGFTAFSSTCPAPELVKTLNELFARFDTLAEKYHQLRIKILGDCYYCISGAPEEREDHAVLCVHMGLSMIEAIKSVREQTKSGVDMRVGIHTGGVLAGVLGQRQWQFDVYSRDVELANKMESSGMPGRVHISEKTYRCLNGEFEVSRSDGASKEEAIRMAGLNTYLIERVIKPYPVGTLDEYPTKPATNGGQDGSTRKKKGSKSKKHKRSSAADVDFSFEESVHPTNIPTTSGGATDPNFAKETDENRSTPHKKRSSDRVYEELVNRENERRLGDNANPFTLTFRQPELEEKFRRSTDIITSISLVGVPIAYMMAGCSSVCLFGREFHIVMILCLGLGIQILFFSTGCGAILSQPVNEHLEIISNLVQRNVWLRLIVIGVMVTVWIGFLTVITMGCQRLPDVCPYPNYLMVVCVACLLGITTITHISHMVKSIVTSVITIFQCVLTVIALYVSFRTLDEKLHGTLSNIHFGHLISGVIMSGAIVVSLGILSRQFEKTTRRMFLWQEEVEFHKKQVADIRRKNEALVCNILPPHVATHFLGRDIEEFELYSRSHDCVGVLFAAMPNFSDFYTEETVNKQGLECLRFLNEVISDFDALLEQARFKCITKIKTIGATYMAASGLDSDVPSDAPDHEKWAHLAALTGFALALKETLNGINMESFNNFVLRMGINHGPITAGVIGARKPHYDVWGNTVNVASRMESTGMAGHIQVVEETANILEQFGYNFTQRGLVTVKGKGQLMTYYLDEDARRRPERLAKYPENEQEAEVFSF